MKNLRILLVDNDEAFAEHLYVYAKLAGWEDDYLPGDDTALLQSTLNELKPNLILLDAHLSLPLKDWLEALKEEDHLKHTWIISGNIAHLEQRIGCYLDEIGGVKEKPISLSELPELAKLSAIHHPPSPPQLQDEDIGQFARQLGAAISLHRIIGDAPKYSPPRWVNDYYQQNPINGGQEKRRLLLLVDRLRQNVNKPFERHVESLPDQNTLYYSRLYRLFNSPDDYWYVRETLPKDTAPHSFFKPPLSLQAFLDELPSLFKHYGITRIRFYKAYKLFNDILPQESRENYLFMPFWQNGGGVEQGWEGCNFTTEDRPDLKKIFEERKARTKPMTGTSCYISWGEQAVDRVVVPIVFEKSTSNRKDEPLGLLAFDRRYDHLPDEERQKSSWWRIYNDKAGEKDRSIGKVTEDELAKMTGLIDQVVNEIKDHRIKSKANQIKLWHEVISNAIRDVLPRISTRRISKESPQVIEGFLAYLVQWWRYIDNEPNDDDLPESAASLDKDISILNWYFLKEEFGDGIRGLGGHGTMADIRKDKTSLIVSPFREALEVDDAIGVHIIQDFAGWVEPRFNSEYNQTQQQNDIRYQNEINKIGSWLGIPLRVNDQRYLMVVQARDNNYFTTRRVKLLRIVALRMSPFLLWDDMRKSRDNLFRSVNYELHSPLATLQQDVCDGILEQTGLQEQLQFLAATINNMMYLYNDVAQNGQSTCLDAIVPTLGFARQANQRRELVQRGMDAYGKYLLAVPEDALKQVLFNLLSNAFKFADQRGKNRGAPIIFEATQENNQLVCRISNPIGEDNRMSDEERKWIFTLNYRTENSGVASGSGLGLYIVSTLCDKTGMGYSAEAPMTVNGILYQTFRLSIPLQHSMGSA